MSSLFSLIIESFAKINFTKCNSIHVKSKDEKNKMRLSSHQLDECRSMRVRVDLFISIVKASRNPYIVIMMYGEEMNIYKNVLEGMLTDTNLKREKVHLLRDLLQIERILSNGKSYDFGNYAKIGLQVDPCNPMFNYRKRKHLIKDIISWSRFYWI